MEGKLRIGLVGADGRMGRTIRQIAEEEGAQVAAQFEAGDPITAAKSDVLVDFSSPSSTGAICCAATESRKPLVIGTTGHSAEDRRVIEAAAAKVPVVLASNFSVGVNVVFALTEMAAKILAQTCDCEVVEAHHRSKKDAPSGTAKTLVEILQRAYGNGSLQHGRKGMVGERNRSEIGIHSIRGGDIVGDHTVIFAANGERLELTHRASSRETFARGALRAAHWVIGKSARLYSMRDVLGL